MNKPEDLVLDKALKKKLLSIIEKEWSYPTSEVNQYISLFIASPIGKWQYMPFFGIKLELLISWYSQSHP